MDSLEQRLLLTNNPPVAYDQDTSPIFHDTTLTGNVYGYDFDADPITFSLVDDAEHGSVALNSATGQFIYDPDYQFVGEDSFTFRISDGSSTSNTAIVLIRVTNSSPISYDASFSTNAGQKLDSYVLATDFEADSPLLFSVVDRPKHGKLVLNSNGTFSYTPDPGFGQDRFTFKANDGIIDGNIATATINVAPPEGHFAPVLTCACSTTDLAPGSPNADPAETAMRFDPLDFTVAPIRYADGGVKFERTDLGSFGFGGFWGQTRGWTNSSAYPGLGSNGVGMVELQLPRLVQINGDATIAAIVSGYNAFYFDLSGSTYTGRYQVKEKLVKDAGSGEFTLIDPDGNRLTYYGFGASIPFFQRGQLKTFTDAAGNVTDLTSRTADGDVAEVVRSNTTGGTTITESFLYEYVATGDNQGLIASVTLRRRTNGGAYSTVRKVEYAYYEDADLYGNARDLKTATIKDGSGATLDVDYYRYYKDGAANGYEHGLKYFFSPVSFARLAAGVANPFTASDAAVAPYADNYFEYDADRRVTKEIAQGLGCSACAGGLGVFTLSYTDSANADGYNSWKRKTVETLPDGNQNIVYTNFAGQVMLSVFRDLTTSQNTINFWQYDASGRIVLHAAPSAITGYNDAYADLLRSISGNYQYLSDNAGLVTIRTYVSGGDADGYLATTALKRGELGAAIPQESFTYTSHTAAGATVVELASRTVYRNTNGTGAQTTSYAYTWFSGTNRIESMTTTYPAEGDWLTGPTTPFSETVFFNTYGQPVWLKDADGYLTYTAYDLSTGAVVATIVDVNTTQTADFTALPSGWSAPNGLHVRTRYEVDALGRTTKTTDPNGNVTYTVYNDANHEVRVYAGWNATTHLPTGPTLVVREDRAGSYTETLTMTATPALDGSGRPTGAESIGSLRSLTREFTSIGGQVLQLDEYHFLAGLGYSTSTSFGSVGLNFDRTSYSYDTRGRLKQVTSPSGTITKTVYDGLNRVTEVWTGTTSLNLVKVSEQQYDDGGVGDGNLTKVTLYPGGGADARVTRYFYDWRDRLIATKDGVQVAEASNVNRPITYLTLDNLGQVVTREMFDGDGVSISDSNNDGVPESPSMTLRRAHELFQYDKRGLLVTAYVSRVDQSSGLLGSEELSTWYWHDGRGNLVKRDSPGGLAEEYKYDGAGRVVAYYKSDSQGGDDWEAALTPQYDGVVEQTEYQYDANGNVLLATTRQLYHDVTWGGSLNDPLYPRAHRTSYVASYYDALNRLTAVVDVGTNGGSAYSRPSTVPARSDTVLVTTYGYDDAGLLQSVTDPRGIVGMTFYDAMGRTIKTIEAYTNGVPTDTTNKTVEYTYDGGNLRTLKVVLPGGGQQSTQYDYAVSGAAGSDVYSNDLNSQVFHPDKSTGWASGAEDEVYTYNALGQVKTATDRNGTVHIYTYDVLGRLISDAITTPGVGIDQSVLRLEYAYDAAGRATLLTSYNAASGGAVVNQVQRVYNSLGQVLVEYQEHGGTVNTATSPKVQYVYFEQGPTTNINHSRLQKMIYPNGRVLHFGYVVGLDDYFNRPTYLADDNGSGGAGTRLETYKYLGLDTVVARMRPEPDVNLTYIKRTGEANGDGGDQYTGLDRFGRVIDQRWLDPATGAATDRFQYGYDRNGNRLYRDNLLDSAMDELYHASGSGNGYDLLNQLTGFVRGALSDSNSDGVLDAVASPSRSQDWDFDALGNWQSVSTNGAAQARTHNAQNQLTGVGAATLTYDANGNMATDETGRKLVYDGWNRLAAVKNAGNVLLVDYAYDALGRRIVADDGTAVHLYYSTEWQMIEERVGGATVAQNVWSPVYVDALVLRDRNADGLGGTLEERLYVQQDANWNVTAITDRTGAVVERYAYDPYGQVSVLAANWTVLSSSSYNWVYLHQGGRYDSHSGLYHFRNRDFSPTLGRWVNQDPIRFVAGDANLYRYTNSNPSNLVDYSGLDSTPWYNDSWLDWVNPVSYYGSWTDRDRQNATSLANLGPSIDADWKTQRDSKFDPLDPGNGPLSSGSIRPGGSTPLSSNTTGGLKAAVPLGAFAYGPPGDLRRARGAQLPGGSRRLPTGVGKTPTGTGKAGGSRDGQRRNYSPSQCQFAKPGPSTDPTAPHNAKIRSEAERLRAQGYTIVAGGGGKEKLIKTPGGKKGGRRPDILYSETPDGEQRGCNVGRTMADGTPVPREVEALDDLNRFGKLPSYFVPYSK